MDLIGTASWQVLVAGCLQHKSTLVYDFFTEAVSDYPFSSSLKES